jgi:PKHD-type hydroxylase
MFYVFPKAVRLELCNEIIRDCKENILEEASIYEPTTQFSRNDPAIRKTSVNFIKDKDNKVNKLAWHFLEEANKRKFHYDLKYFQEIQFAEYQKGDFFDWHQDTIESDENNELRKLSLTLVLSDPDTYEGGEFQFFNGGRPMKGMGDRSGEQVAKDIKAKGSIVVFDSRDWHRVCEIQSGVRNSIVCWTVGDNFK